MPRPSVRRPAPIVLPNCPMDTLWEVDESSGAPLPPPKHTSRFMRSEPLRSVFEDDDDDDVRNVSFPLPPRSNPVKRFFRMNLPIHSPPKPRRSSPTPPRPRRAPPPPPRAPSPVACRPVSPTSSASSSDTEPPRTPPTTSCSLPKPAYMLPPPPPAEWESAIDELFEFADQEDELQAKPVHPPRTSSRRTSYVWPDEDISFMCMSPTSAFPMSPTSTGWAPVGRPPMSPGFMPMSVSPPSQRWLSLAS